MAEGDLFSIGADLYEDGKMEEALEAFLEGAISGDTSCMTRLASMYTCGEGMECCDYEQAIYWEEKAASLGDVTAYLNLAISYRIKGDLYNFRNWCEKAIASGDGSAALELSKLFIAADQTEKAEHYLGVAISSLSMSPSDLEEAKSLLSKVEK